MFDGEINENFKKSNLLKTSNFPKLNYVASGLTHTRLATKSSKDNADVVSIIRTLSKKIQGENNHDFSVLFNAFAEVGLEEVVGKFFDGSMYDIHTDSGGLQIVTLGKVITPEIKKNIYKIQARSSDMAMGFDEIPVDTDLNSKSKSYNSERLDYCALKTKENLKEQIQFFIDNNSRAKVLPIIQGNSEESYKQWHKILMKDISSDESKKIAGLAFGFSSFGKGLMESIEICKMLQTLETEISTIHLLGMGSISRLLPFIALIKSGYLNKYKRISFDSTSHTQNTSYGKYLFRGNESASLIRAKNKTFFRIWENFKEIMKDYLSFMRETYDIDFTIDSFYYTLCDQKNFEFKSNHPIEHRGIMTFLYFISQVLNFTWTINALLNNDNFLKEQLQIFDKKSLILLEIKDDNQLKDFLHKASFTSSRIPQKGLETNILF